jgi:hypothetical protein
LVKDFNAHEVRELTDKHLDPLIQAPEVLLNVRCKIAVAQLRVKTTSDVSKTGHINTLACRA